MQVWNLLHVARCKNRTQKSRQKSPSGHHRTISSGYIFATKAHIDNRKKLLSSNMSSTCPHNMVNFGPLAAKIDPVVSGTPANYNGFRTYMRLFNRSYVIRPLPTYWPVYWYSRERLLEQAVRKQHNYSFFTDYTRGKLDQLGYIFGALDIANCALSCGSMLG